VCLVVDDVRVCGQGIVVLLLGNVAVVGLLFPVEVVLVVVERLAQALPRGRLGADAAPLRPSEACLLDGGRDLEGS
jgi:hypothetical protein